jgi:peptidoglycan/xylan/chitin deacetylase (PgdA/CDA1 family)
VLKLHSIAAAPAALAYWLGLAGGAVRANGRARILMLHGIPRRHAGLFERIVRYVRRHFRVVPLRTLLSDNMDLNGCLAITFDDGLRNNVQVAYPILKEYGVPATFFVCPGLVDAGRWLWNHEARQRLRRVVASPEEIESVIYGMKRMPLAERLRMEASIREATPAFQPTAEERHEFDLASWQELRELDPRLVTIGSHTMTHPILPSLDDLDIENEVAESRRLLERRLGRPVELFAYPNGDVDAATLACVRRNYAGAVTVEEGLVGPMLDPHLLPRLNVPGSVLRFALALHKDYFFETPISVSGSQVASSGKSVISAMQSTIMKKNGSEASAT